MIRLQTALIFALVLPFFILPASAQEPSDTEAYRQALQEEVTLTREQVREKGAVFLDPSRAVDERLEAVRDVSGLIDAEQIERAKRLVASGAASPIRARAIELTTSALIQDEDFVRAVLDRLADSTEVLEVRQAASEAIQSSLMSITFVAGLRDYLPDNNFARYPWVLLRDALELNAPFPWLNRCK